MSPSEAARLTTTRPGHARSTTRSALGSLGPLPALLGVDLSTRSFIARPTETSYAGVYVHFDGSPSGRLPLLLTAYQNRFGGDVEALARHLVDDMDDFGWEELGTDLLDGAPDDLRQSLTGGSNFPSRKLDSVTNSDGSPAERQLITQGNGGGLEWGYVLHPAGIEVICLSEEDRGPIVEWHTDPRARFSDSPMRWKPDRPVPATLPPRATQTVKVPAQPTATSTIPRSGSHR